MNKTATPMRTIPIRNAVMISLICLFVGFIIGVVFTSYKLNKAGEAISQGNQAIDYKKKIKAMKDELSQNPENVSAWIQLGHVYYDTNQYQEAITAYEKALSMNPQNPDVLTDLGVMYRRAGKPQKAIAAFDRAIAVNEKHETSRLNKGIVLMNDLKERENALQVWGELLEINPLVMANKDQSLDQLIQHYKEH